MFNDFTKFKPDTHEVPSVEVKDDAQHVPNKLNEFISSATVDKIAINIDERALRETKFWLLGWYEYFFGNAQEKAEIDPPKRRIRSPNTIKDVSTIYKPYRTNLFVEGVFLVLLTMFIATALGLMYVLVTPAVKKLLEVDGWAILIPALMLLSAVYYGAVCANGSRQSSCMFIFLYFEVGIWSVILALMTSQCNTYMIYYGVIATTMVVFVCLLLACTDFNFSSRMLHAIVIGTTFVAIAIIVLVVLKVTDKFMESSSLTALFIGTLIQAEMIVMQLQLMLRGESLKLNETDYSLGAFLLYISIIIVPFKILFTIALKLTHEERQK